MDYEILKERVMNVYDISDLDLLRLYYCDKFNSDAIRKRRDDCESGERLGDKYIVIPRIKKINECLSRVGFDAFFEQDEVVAEGLTLGDFASSLAGFMAGFRNYIEREVLLDTGWRN